MLTEGRSLTDGDYGEDDRRWYKSRKERAKKQKKSVAGRARGLYISRSKTEEATGNEYVALKSRQSASHHSKGNHVFLVFFSTLLLSSFNTSLKNNSPYSLFLRLERWSMFVCVHEHLPWITTGFDQFNLSEKNPNIHLSVAVYGHRWSR